MALAAAVAAAGRGVAAAVAAAVAAVLAGLRVGVLLLKLPLFLLGLQVTGFILPSNFLGSPRK